MSDNWNVCQRGNRKVKLWFPPKKWALGEIKVALCEGTGKILRKVSYKKTVLIFVGGKEFNLNYPNITKRALGWERDRDRESCVCMCICKLILYWKKSNVSLCRKTEWTY